MKIYILGLDHEIQVIDGKRDATLNSEFKKLLQELIRKHQIDFIGEETYPEINSAAKAIAKALDIPWRPIEMSMKARTELGIEEEQAKQRHDISIGDDGVILETQRVPSDAIREAYMIWRTLTEARKAESILVLCGFMHSDELRQLFEKAGAHVTLDSLCKYPWYSHPDCPDPQTAQGKPGQSAGDILGGRML